MTHIAVQNIEKKFINKKTPVLRPGYQVRVHQKIKEGEKERVQIFEGLVISLNSGHGSSKTFKVRKIVEGIGVEKTFPLYSPNIVKIEIKKTFKVRRAKLIYLRKPEGLSKRLSAKLGLIERDENLKKKKGLMDEEKTEVSMPQPEATSEVSAENSDVTEESLTEVATTETVAEPIVVAEEAQEAQATENTEVSSPNEEKSESNPVAEEATATNETKPAEGSSQSEANA